MSQYRISVEWGIGGVKQKWQLLTTKVFQYCMYVDFHNLIAEGHDGIKKSDWSLLVSGNFLDQHPYLHKWVSLKGLYGWEAH